MATKKHTPGPWFANRTAPCWEVRGGGKPIAYLPKHHQEIANARLIAATPELLTELTAICEQAESWHNFHKGSDCVHCDEICKLIPRMKAAIRKATEGES